MHQHCTIVSGHSQAFYLNFTFHYDQVALALLTPRVKNKLVFFFLCVTRLIGLLFSFFFLSSRAFWSHDTSRRVDEAKKEFNRVRTRRMTGRDHLEEDEEPPVTMNASFQQARKKRASWKKEIKKERKIRRGSGFVRAKTICMVVTLSVASQRRNLFLG